MSDTRTVGQVIQHRREQLGMSVREAARQAKISEGRLRQIEKGYAVAAAGMHVPVRPKDGTLRQIAAVLDLDPQHLVTVAQEQQRSPVHPDARGEARSAFARLILADPTLDDDSKHHIIRQHGLLQKGSFVSLELVAGEISAAEIKQDAATDLAELKAVKASRRKRENPGA